MKTKFSPTVVGAFVIGAFALGIISLLAFGGVNFFAKPQRFVVYFDESVHGLTLGSPVKLRGVPIGRVVDLAITYDPKKNVSVVAVVCELSRDKLADNTGASIDVSARAELQQLVDRGLRAQLGVQGLATGLLFVELDFHDPKEYPAPARPQEKFVVVPYVPSAISEFQNGISEVLANFRRVDMAGLARDLSALANTARKQVDGVDLKGMAEQWKKTGAQVETLVTNPDIKKTFENLNAAAGELRTVIARLDAQIDPTSRELASTLAETRKTLESFRATAATAQGFLDTHSGLGGEVAGTLSHLNEAAEAVKRLADFLERNPNALITGRKRPDQP
jgi:paraquat-inducible protein B